MTKIIFHVGMGKTGTSSIQEALAQNHPALEAAGIRYLGQWTSFAGGRYDEFSGFQKFLELPEKGLVEAAEALLGWCAGLDRVLISNEQYMGELHRLRPFFTTLAAGAEVQAIILVRRPAAWLPSAYAQWGVVHKTNAGPVQPFATAARRLMKQYDQIRPWREFLGPALTVRPFHEDIDVVEDFGRLLGVSLTTPTDRRQTRPGVPLTMIRAAYNNARPQPTLPDIFHQMMRSHVPAGTPASLSAKFAHLFDQSEIPAILAENHQILTYLEREFDLVLTSGDLPKPPTFDLPSLTDELLGRMLDLICGQAQRIEELETKLNRLEQSGRGASDQ